MAAGVKALELGARAMVVARDGRLSSVELSAAPAPPPACM